MNRMLISSKEILFSFMYITMYRIEGNWQDHAELFGARYDLKILFSFS